MMNPTPMVFAMKEYSILFLLLPIGLLFPIVGLLYLKFRDYIANRITNKLLSFNILAVVGLILAAILITLFGSITLGIKTGWEKFRFFENLTVSVVVLLMIVLPIVNVFRFIELLIDRKIQNVSLRIVLNFLTTLLFPFAAFFLMYYLKWGGNWHAYEFLQLSYIFIGILIIASFRSLYSYNIHKEKELIRTNESKLSLLRELKTKAELNSLHSQINPHFLYNALNSIAGLAHENADKTEYMALSLSKLFRYSINKEKSDWTTLEEELEMVKIYLEVEKVRFDERLTYSVEIPDTLREYRIPRFTIQPLVENAVKHGIAKLIKPGKIGIVVTFENNWLTIDVYDSGPAFPDDLNPGIGLQGIYDKLEILYPDRFEMNFSNSPLKKVTIRLK